MLDAEKHLLMQFTVITHDWPMESKVSLRDAILAALNERTKTERDRCAKLADSFAEQNKDGHRNAADDSFTTRMLVNECRALADAIRNQ